MPHSQGRLRRLVIRLALFIAACSISLALLEGLLTGFAWMKFKTIDVEELTAMETGTRHIDDQKKGYLVTLDPHPYLSYVHNENVEGIHDKTTMRVNNLGLIGRDFPVRRNPKKFTILVTGGSVAQQLCRAGEGGRSYLERELNDRYQLDREVVVLNGGMSAWKEPQQAILYLLYGEVADAVVTLDGYNEQLRLKGERDRLEYPNNDLHRVDPMADGGWEALGAAWQSQQLRRFSLNYPWRTVYFATRFARDRLRDQALAMSKRTNLKESLSLPADWPREEYVRFNMEQYQKYVRSIDALARMHHAKTAHFIQPCPALEKTLTDEEKRTAGDVSYAERYRQIETGLMSLNEEGVPVVSLVDVFKETRETVYKDDIHCQFGDTNDYSHAVNFLPSRGYEIMARAMADRLAALWSLPAK